MEQALAFDSYFQDVQEMLGDLCLKLRTVWVTSCELTLTFTDRSLDSIMDMCPTACSTENTRTLSRPSPLTPPLGPR